MEDRKEQHIRNPLRKGFAGYSVIPRRDLCATYVQTGADFIKTSTGFAEGGADRHSVCVMANEIRSNHLRLKIKAAGGIRSLEEAEWYIEHGCERIGTSSALKM